MVKAIINGKLFDSEDGTWEYIHTTQPPTVPHRVYSRKTETERLLVINTSNIWKCYSMPIYVVDNLLSDIITSNFGYEKMAIEILTKLGITLEPL